MALKTKQDDDDRIVGTGPAAGPAQPEYDDRGRLTRKGMEAVLANGGSVLYHKPGEGGAIVGTAHLTHPDHLPSEADLAKGDEAREAVARENLLRQKKAIEAQIAGLGAAEKAGK